uniref:Uncharacterized protein n=1 Tax=viral metagenome TaxID=1070528 RepID=A0A6C0BD16_9ZZZZ
MDNSIYGLLIIAAVAFALLVADRMLRISKYIEPFQGTEQAQCGVDLPPCNHPLSCVNGYCRGTAPPRLPVSDLPVLP